MYALLQLFNKPRGVTSTRGLGVLRKLECLSTTNRGYGLMTREVAVGKVPKALDMLDKLSLSYTPSPAFLVLNNGVALGKQGGLQDAKHTRHLEVVGQLVIARWRGKSIHSQE